MSDPRRSRRSSRRAIRARDASMSESMSGSESSRAPSAGIQAGRVRALQIHRDRYRPRARGGPARSLVRGIAPRPATPSPVGGIGVRRRASTESWRTGLRYPFGGGSPSWRSSSARLRSHRRRRARRAPIAARGARVRALSDPISYTLVPGGDFESGAAGWKLTGGASRHVGNEPGFYLRGAGDNRSLYLPAGSSATSPFVLRLSPSRSGLAALSLVNRGRSSALLPVWALIRTPLGTFTLPEADVLSS